MTPAARTERIETVHLFDALISDYGNVGSPGVGHGHGNSEFGHHYKKREVGGYRHVVEATRQSRLRSSHLGEDIKTVAGPTCPPCRFSITGPYQSGQAERQTEPITFA